MRSRTLQGRNPFQTRTLTRRKTPRLRWLPWRTMHRQVLCWTPPPPLNCSGRRFLPDDELRDFFDIVRLYTQQHVPPPAPAPGFFKLPAFVPSNPRAYFKSVEAQFSLRGITDPVAKFNHVFTNLESDVTRCVASMFADEPTAESYGLSKARLISLYTPPLLECVEQVMSTLPELGDRLPSNLYIEIDNLVPEHMNCPFCDTMFLKEAPGFRTRNIVQRGSFGSRARRPQCGRSYPPFSPLASAINAVTPSGDDPQVAAIQRGLFLGRFRGPRTRSWSRREFRQTRPDV